jgi:hypothetical protein
MLKTKLKNCVYQNRYIDLNKRISYIDLDIKRISEYIHKIDIQNKTTILKTIDLKKIELFNLKHTLNIKKKVYIDLLRNYLNDLYKKNPLNLFSDDKININPLYVKNLLLDLKILKENNGIPVFIALNFYNNNINTIKKLMAINEDIKHIENFIKNYNTYYNELTNKPLRVTEFDLKLLEKNIISYNIKKLFYFYFAKAKKKSKSKNLLNSAGLVIQLANNLINQNDLIIIIENNLKENFKTLNFDELNLKLQNEILNKYI